MMRTAPNCKAPELPSLGALDVPSVLSCHDLAFCAEGVSRRARADASAAFDFRVDSGGLIADEDRRFLNFTNALRALLRREERRGAVYRIAEDFFERANDRLNKIVGGFTNKQLAAVIDVLPSGAAGIVRVHSIYPSVLAAIFMRAQEQYESPEFRGRSFSKAEFHSWYSRAGDLKLPSYYFDYSGWNIPRDHIDHFISGTNGDLTPEERHIPTILSLAPEDTRYLIVTSGNCESDPRSGYFGHEMAHALYHTDENYRREVDRELEGHDCSELVDYLDSTAGYHRDVYQDEIQAMLATTGALPFLCQRIGASFNEAVQRYTELNASIHSAFERALIRQGL